MSVPMNQILQEISLLSLEDQEFLIQLVTKRWHDAKRYQLQRRINEAEANYQAGQVTVGTVAKLMEQLNHD